VKCFSLVTEILGGPQAETVSSGMTELSPQGGSEGGELPRRGKRSRPGAYRACEDVVRCDGFLFWGGVTGLGIFLEADRRAFAIVCVQSFYKMRQNNAKNVCKAGVSLYNSDHIRGWL